MIIKLKKVIVSVLAAAILFGTFAISGAAKITQSDIDKIQDQINNAEAEIDKLNNSKYELADKRKELEKELAALREETDYNKEKKRLLDLQLEYVMSELSITEDIIEQCEKDISAKKILLEETSKQLQTQKELFVEFFRSNYEQGSTKLKYIEILLTSRSISDFILNVQYIGSILDYEQYLLDSTENLIVTYESQMKDLEDMYAIQNENKASLEQTKATVDEVSELTAQYILQLFEDQEKAQSIHDQLHDDELAVLDELKQLEAEKDKYIQSKEELEEELEEQKRREEEERKKQELLEQMQQQGGNGSFVSGNLTYEKGWCFPVDYAKARYTDNFGWRPDPFHRGKRVYHHGIDLALPAGNNIYAVDSGTVLISKYSSSLGNYVVILHSNGYKTYYAHASKLLVKVGERVSQGDVIALVGTTGSSTGNHLHFAVVTPGGDYTDPENFFPSLLGSKTKYFVD